MSALKGRVGSPVHFQHYQDGNLIYKCEWDGFEFPVPVTDCGSARFAVSDRGMLFMRWIRKHMDVIEKARDESGVKEECTSNEKVRGC